MNSLAATPDRGPQERVGFKSLLAAARSLYVGRMGQLLLLSVLGQAVWLAVCLTHDVPPFGPLVDRVFDLSLLTEV